MIGLSHKDKKSILKKRRNIPQPGDVEAVVLHNTSNRTANMGGYGSNTRGTQYVTTRSTWLDGYQTVEHRWMGDNKG